MLLTTNSLVWKYWQHSKLKDDHKRFLGFIVGQKWTGEAIAERLVSAGLATVAKKSAVDGRILEVYCPKEPTISEVELACLGKGV